MEEKTLKKRSQADPAMTWCLEDLYETKEAWENDCACLKKEMEAFSVYEGTLKNNMGQLSKVIRAYSDMMFTFERIYVYANQKYHEDTSDSVGQEMAGKASRLSVEIDGAVSFLEPEILSLPEETLKEWMEQPEMKEWKRFLQKIERSRAHTLSTEMEALLSRVAELGQAPSNIYSMFNNADLKFKSIEAESETIPVTQGRYITLLQNPNREIRKKAFASLYEGFSGFKNTVAAAFEANVKQAAFFAKERHYSSAREMALSRNVIPETVYDGLIEAVHERMDLMYRYLEVKKKMLGLPDLHLYDITVPLVAGVDRTYTYEEAKEIVTEALKPLGEEYGTVLKEAFESRWIDVYENEGKRNGAYSWGAYGTHPYVLLNFQGDLHSVFTLAHEMGHAMHSWHSDRAQNYLNAGYPIFVAEVASTCNETLLIRHLLKQTEDKKERQYLICYLLEQFRTTLYRQTMFAEFERDVHAACAGGETLTAKKLSDVYYALNERYFGNGIVLDDAIRYEWERIPHFYTPFYVYQYATGFSAAIALADQILKGEEGAVERYIGFLSGGGSKDPIDLLKDCGVDMTSKDAVTKALDVFKEYLTEIEAIC